MIVFPNGKINLGLRIFNRRPDGFHNIESVFYPVQWRDALEVIADDRFSFEMEGIKIGGNAEENLCVKAYHLLEKEFNLVTVKMCLLKNIPTGAGLGGGSSDGAFTLKLLNEFFKLKLSTNALKKFAAQLGSDCSFFIENKPSLVFGRGDEPEEIDLDLSSFHIVIVHPAIEINTGWAYEKLNQKRSANATMKVENESIASLLQRPVQQWKEFLVNDFEEMIFDFHPKLRTVKQQLYDSGALYASMSGTGSAIYGIFSERRELAFGELGKVFIGKL